MPLDFVKMHGAGNDYVMVDGFAWPDVIDNGAEIAPVVSERRFGIGGDGLIAIGPSNRADVRMWMWNSDGSRGAMCGNGLRLCAAFAIQSSRVNGDRMQIETDSGVLAAAVQRDAQGAIVAARVQMPRVEVFARPDAIVVGERSLSFWTVDAGNPHAVVFVDEDPERVPLESVATVIRRLPRFPSGVNVEVVQVVGGDRLIQRTFERGSGETWACGSGATAAAMAALRSRRLSIDSVRVRMRGGEVRIHRLADDRADLEGPVVRVFDGRLGD
ncbi:MAG: diaminopimelate epimerase [Planctomycetota bacterium]